MYLTFIVLKLVTMKQRDIKEKHNRKCETKFFINLSSTLISLKIIAPLKICLFAKIRSLQSNILLTAIDLCYPCSFEYPLPKDLLH